MSATQNNEPRMSIVAILGLVGIELSLLALLLVAYALVQAQAAPLPRPDAVKEYATNRLCKISIGECERLAHVIIISQSSEGDTP